MICKRNHLMYQFSIPVTFFQYHFSITTIHCASFFEQNALKKKLVEMLIEQNIEFELRGHGPPSRTCTSITG